MSQIMQSRAGRFFAGFAIFVLASSLITLYLLCLTGSTYTNPHVPQIFLAQIQKSGISIAIGFYGICADPSSPNITCATTVNRSADAIAATLFPNADQTASSNASKLITFALDLQQRILVSPLPIAAGVFLLSLFFITLTSMIAKRQRHLVPGRRLRYLKTFTLDLVWVSTALVFTATMLATEMLNGEVYVISMLGDGNTSMTAGRLLQVLLWVLFGFEIVFSAVITWVLRDRRGESGAGRVDFERGIQEFEDDHIILI